MNSCRAPKRPAKPQLERFAASSSTANKPVEQFPFREKSKNWIAVIEDCNLKKDASKIAEVYLKNHFNPFLLPKNRYFFEKILEETGSVRIVHNHHRHDISFSKFFILKVWSIVDWGIVPFESWELKDIYVFPKEFNVYDYMEAWENFLLYHNSKLAHSWFASFRLSNAS